MKKIPTKDELLLLLQESVKRFNTSIDCESLLRGYFPGLEEQVGPFRVAHEQAISPPPCVLFGMSSAKTGIHYRQRPDCC